MIAIVTKLLKKLLLFVVAMGLKQKKMNIVKNVKKKGTNVVITPYIKRKHESDLITILFNRGLKADLSDDLPEYAWVALENDEIVALGAIRRIEGHYVLFDSYITNPLYSPAERDKALDRITSKMIKICMQHGIKKILAFSVEDNIVTRSIKHGFESIPHKMTFKIL